MQELAIAAVYKETLSAQEGRNHSREGCLRRQEAEPTKR